MLLPIRISALAIGPPLELVTKPVTLDWPPTFTLTLAQIVLEPLTGIVTPAAFTNFQSSRYVPVALGAVTSTLNLKFEPGGTVPLIGTSPWLLKLAPFTHRSRWPEFQFVVPLLRIVQLFVKACPAGTVVPSR